MFQALYAARPDGDARRPRPARRRRECQSRNWRHLNCFLTYRSHEHVHRAIDIASPWPGWQGRPRCGNSWPSLIGAVGSLGVGDAVTYLVARERKAGATAIATAIVIALVQSVPLVGLALLADKAILGAYASSLGIVPYFYAATIPLGLLAGYTISWLAGMLNYGRMNLVRMSVIAFTLAGQLVLWLAHSFTVSHVLLATLGANVACVALAAGLVRAAAKRGAADVGVFRFLVGYGIRSHTANLATTLTDRLDQGLFLPSYRQPISASTWWPAHSPLQRAC